MVTPLVMEHYMVKLLIVLNISLWLFSLFLFCNGEKSAFAVYFQPILGGDQCYHLNGVVRKFLQFGKWGLQIGLNAL